MKSKELAILFDDIEKNLFYLFCNMFYSIHFSQIAHKILFGILGSFFFFAINLHAQVSYSTLNYPGGAVGDSTFLTGIRAVGDGSVYMTGVYTPAGQTATQGLIYEGSLAGTGTWHTLNASIGGQTVTSTALYGPNPNGAGVIRAVGSYKTVASGSVDIGVLYNGSTNGNGTWTSMNAVSLNASTINTIAHSTMGNYVVGNYDTNITGKAFIYDVGTQGWINLNGGNGANGGDGISGGNIISITAYGIWWNGGSNYTIAGGFSNGVSLVGLDQGYIVDWDSSTNTTSHWKSYNFNNVPITDSVSHFDGITSDGGTGYNLTGDWIGLGAADGLGFFANVGRAGDGSFTEASWTQINYPSCVVTSGNSVYENSVIGIYTLAGGNGTYGYVATVPEPSTWAMLTFGIGFLALAQRVKKGTKTCLRKQLSN